MTAALLKRELPCTVFLDPHNANLDNQTAQEQGRAKFSNGHLGPTMFLWCNMLIAIQELVLGKRRSLRYQILVPD